MISLKPAEPAQPDSRLVGVCSWSLQPKGIDDLIIKVKACGISNIQLAMEPLRAELDGWGTAGDCFTKLDDAGIRVVSGMFEPLNEDYSSLDAIKQTGGLRQNKHWAANLKHAGQVAKMASEFGVSLVTFHAGFLPDDTGDKLHQVMHDRIEQVAAAFASADILCGLETGQERAETLLDTLDSIDEELLGINFDPANMILYNMGDPCEALEILADYVMQIHIKDAIVTTKAGQWGTEVAAGTGEVDWKRFFATATELLPKVDIDIEREAGEQRMADIKTARKLVKAKLGI